MGKKERGKVAWWREPKSVEVRSVRAERKKRGGMLGGVMKQSYWCGSM